MIPRSYIEMSRYQIHVSHSASQLVMKILIIAKILHDFQCSSARVLQMENVLIDAQGHLQVTDFGLSKWLKRGEKTRTVCGTLNYIGKPIS